MDWCHGKFRVYNPIPGADPSAFHRLEMNDQYSLEDSDDQIRLRKAWSQVTKRASADIPGQSFEKFIRPLTPSTLTDDVAVIAAPGKFIHEWVQTKCLRILESYLSDELGKRMRIELTWHPREKPTGKPDHAVVVRPAVEHSAFTPNDRYTFDSFVVGQSNRMAHAGAKAVSIDPGKRYNPLFICGPSGLGKTHLLHAIARDVLAREPKTNIVYITAQQFAEDFVNALQANRVDNFRRSQRNVNLWLVDDIQFIAGKDKTQEEVFHTFNHLSMLGKQIVICADRPPRELHMMDERLRTRFEAGLVADIQMPDTETRCAIILSKAAQDKVPLQADVAFYLAENVPGNIRQLEGALTRLTVQASLDEQPINLAIAETMVEKHYRGALEKPAVSEIIDTVGKQFKISAEEITGISRKAPIVEARHVAIYITREITGDSWKHIGSQFGNRDHTSMMHGHQKVQELMLHDKSLRTVVRSMIRNLYPNL
jgi:chromosomal replication initiator protein